MALAAKPFVASPPPGFVSLGLSFRQKKSVRAAQQGQCCRRSLTTTKHNPDRNRTATIGTMSPATKPNIERDLVVDLSISWKIAHDLVIDCGRQLGPQAHPDQIFAWCKAKHLGVPTATTSATEPSSAETEEAAKGGTEPNESSEENRNKETDDNDDGNNGDSKNSDQAPSGNDPSTTMKETTDTTDSTVPFCGICH